MFKKLNLKNNNCLIIAEIGVNHNGNLNLAKKMILAAKKSGADAVKFQTFKAENLVTKKTPKVKYQKKSSPKNESHFEMIKKLELNYSDHFQLKSYCEKLDIEFISTPYDIESAKFLNDELNIKFFKTASADIVDLPLQSYIASTGKFSIISLGMATMNEIRDVVKIHDKNNIVLMHCVSNYPCSDKSLNLNVIQNIKKKFKTKVGFSDHSIGHEASIIALSLGASVIEKHFTINKTLPGPDQLASSDPKEFKILTKAIRRAENMFGESNKKIQPEEIEMSKVSRKSITLAKKVIAGNAIEYSDLTLKRPGTGLMAREMNKILGKKAIRDLEKDHQITYEDIK